MNESAIATIGPSHFDLSGVAQTCSLLYRRLQVCQAHGTQGPLATSESSHVRGTGPASRKHTPLPSYAKSPSQAQSTIFTKTHDPLSGNTWQTCIYYAPFKVSASPLVLIGSTPRQPASQQHENQSTRNR